ncbi:MAG: single-stranded nucleic acid binding protein [Edaphobacter sp.]|nr:single-stranded nucleic acid binding protein [Edaphobacter sp.]
MDDLEPGSRKIEDFLQALVKTGGLNLKFSILACNGQVQPDPGRPAGQTSPVLTKSSSPDSPSMTPDICVEFTGPDTPLLTARNGELLLAIEHIAAKILRFEHEDHERISFDAENFKVLRRQELLLVAEAAVEEVRRTGQPHSFNPMSSRERRLLHLALATSGLPTASSGMGPRRFVVLYPEGQQPSEAATSAAPSQDRTRAIRNAFRRR